MVWCCQGSKYRRRIGDTQLRWKRKWIGSDRFNWNVRFEHAKSTEGQAERRAAKEAPTLRQQGAEKGDTSTQTDRKGQGARNRTGRGARARVKLGEAKAKIPKSKRNLKLRLRGSVAIQAQHWVHERVRNLVRMLGAQNRTHNMGITVRKPRDR